MLKYTDRHEISQIERMFRHSCVTNSAYYEISGKSGSGKTELIKKTVDRICQADSFIVYIDVINDEYISTSFYLSILENVYMPITHLSVKRTVCHVAIIVILYLLTVICYHTV